jgi:hypothetical protein
VTPWTISADADLQSAEEPTVGLAMDVDPRRPALTLGVRILTGGGPEFWQNAVRRRFFEGAQVDWRPALEWLRGVEAAALMRTVSEGYTGEMRWTGDWVGSWTEEASAALDALHAGVDARALR